MEQAAAGVAKDADRALALAVADLAARMMSKVSLQGGRILMNVAIYPDSSEKKLQQWLKRRSLSEN